MSVDIIARGLAARALSEGRLSTHKVRAWAESFTGVGDIKIMASPPAVTVSSNNGSSITGSNGSSLKKSFTDLTLGGFAEQVTVNASPSVPRLQGYGPNNTDGSKRKANLVRARFTITAPAFEVCYFEGTGPKINALVDGEFVTAGGVGVVPNPLQAGQVRYMKFDFGADVVSYGFGDTTIGTAGTGYAVGDIVTLSGGTYARPLVAKVGSASGGIPSKLYIQDPGDYSALPSFPAATTTSGSGSGLTIGSGSLRFPIHSTVKPRQVELLIESAELFGLQYNSPSAAAVVTPYHFNPVLPKLYWLGDSQDASTYGVYAGGQMGYLVAHRLGLTDNLTIDAIGGTGFAKANGVSPAFEHANRVNAAIAANPDILVFPFSQNIDTQTTSTAAAVDFIQTLQATLPDALFVMLSPACGFQSWHLTAMQAVMAAAPDPARIRMVDAITEGWATDTTTAGGSTGYLTTDNTHWGAWGNLHWRSKLLAEAIAWRVQDMVLNA